jgi:hypothetical protein
MEELSPSLTSPIITELGAMKLDYSKLGIDPLFSLHLKEGTNVSSLVRENNGSIPSLE